MQFTFKSGRFTQNLLYGDNEGELANMTCSRSWSKFKQDFSKGNKDNYIPYVLCQSY